MQDTTEFRTNRDLFSNHYLDEHLPETDAWESVDSTELRETYEDIVNLWEEERDSVTRWNEPQLEKDFIRPVFDMLGIPYIVEESVDEGQRRPDYGFFQSSESADGAFVRRDEGGDFYRNAVAVADAKRWGRKLDTRGKQQRDFENPSYQIHVYLQETPTTWAVLTNGEYWRLYYGPTSHRLDSYYEIHLPTVLESGDLEAFKYFYLFFRHEAFLSDASGDCFLDDVYSESNVFAEELGEDLQDNIYDAIQSLAEGFLTYPKNDLEADDLDLIHDSSLIYLYRLIFVLYAESEGRDLLNTDNEIYEQSYSLNTIKQEVAQKLDSDQPSYQSWQSNLWNRIDELFQLIDQGSASQGIPEEDLHIPAYNGGLFRTDPNPDDSPEAQFLATHAVGDEYLARVIELLTRSQTGTSGKIFVDYSSLDVRHLGNIYEGLLEYQLNVADEPLGLEDGEYEVVEESEEAIVEPGEVYLTTDSGERKATGSYYTPEYVVEYIVENTLEPLVEGIREDLAGNVSYEDDDESGFAEEFAQRIFELKILDPAMGSGHFLTNTIDYLAREIIDAQERQAEQQGVETVGEGQDINWARRQVAQHCIYGVDLNPLAVELAKVSLWLRTLAAEQPLAFLDHHLKTGNSLVGSDIEAIDELETDANGGPNASLADFGAVRRGTIDHLMDVYEEFIAIENTDLADAKEMERRYREIERDDLRNRMVAMANVKTAEDFDLDLPSGAYERMARALDSDSEWTDVEATDWFRSAQMTAEERNFLHWKLEFPEVFYEVDGSARENPGFDAMIGNPPYGDILSPITKRYCRRVDKGFESERADAFTAFTAIPHMLLKENGLFGYIIPNTPLRGKQFSEFRQTNSTRYCVDTIVDFGNDYVFDEEVFTTIIQFQNQTNEDEYVSSYTEATSDEIPSSSVDTRIAPSESEPWIPDDPLTNSIKQSERTVELDPNIGSCHDAGIDYKVSGQGWQNRGEDVKISDLILYEGDRESPNDHRYIGGGEITEYHISPEDKWLRHDYESFIEGDIVIQVYPQYTEVSEKIVTRQTTDSIVGALDTDQLYTAKSVHTTLLSDDRYALRYVLSILNSKLIDYVYESVSGEEGQSFAQVKIHELRDLPICEIDFECNESQRRSELENLKDQYQDSSESPILETQLLEEKTDAALHDFLSHLTEQLETFKQSRQALNLFLPDYFGTYGDGPTLGDLYQPSAGLADSILTDTTEEHANLKFGRITLVDDGGKLVVRATARYKPKNPDEHETDRWDYTETDPESAMEFVGLSDAKRALIRAFVPHATDEGGGFAGFRESATKTNSLVDRLEALTLPALSDVEDGLDRYQQTKERAEELDENIEKTDELIDQIVYQLYGLTDDEIEIIEEAVGDD